MNKYVLKLTQAIFGENEMFLNDYRTNFVAGIINQEEKDNFERIIYRATRGSTICIMKNIPCEENDNGLV
jgi:hypothetical protein